MPDVCVIGGGVIGLSIARELAGRDLQVTLLSRDAARATASWAAGGIFPAQPRGGPPPDGSPLEQFTAVSDRLHRVWAEELEAETGIDTGLRRCGTIAISTDDETLAELGSESARWRRLGVRHDPLLGDEIARLEPALGAAVAAGTVLGGCHLPDETQLRPPRHLAALRSSCRSRGVIVVDNATVAGIECSAGRITAVRFAQPDGRSQTVTADVVCLAAGAWSQGLLAHLGLDLPTRPWRGQILLHRIPPGCLSRVVNLGAGYDYLIPRDDGRLLVGSTIEDAGYDTTTTPEAIGRLEQLVRRLLPQTRLGAAELSWAGLRPGAADGRPTIGPIPGFDNAWVATGHYRAGLHLSTGTAVAVADMIAGRPVDPAMAAFAADRHGTAVLTPPPG